MAQAADPAAPKRVRRRKAPPAGAYPEPMPAPKRRRARVSLPALETYSTRLRGVVLNLAFVAAALLFVPVLVSQFLRDEVVIATIAVPKPMADSGLTGDVVAARIWDGIRDATAQARTSKASISALPDTRRVTFTVPNSGISMDSLVRQTRAFFNVYPPQIVGEFTCSDPECSREGLRLRLRVLAGTSRVIDLPPLGQRPLRDYFTDAGIEILAVLDPFVATSAVADTQPVRAIALARAIIRQGHKDAKWAHNLIGNIRREQLQDTLALPEYRAALAIDPNFAIAQGNLATTLLAVGQKEEARKALERLSALAPTLPTVFRGYGELAAKEGKPDEALALLEKAAELDRNDPQFAARMGQIEEERGRTAEARTYYERALAIDPAFFPALNALFLLLAPQGDFDALRAMTRNAANVAPDDAEVLMLHAIVEQLSGSPGDAARIFETAMALAPDNVEILVLGARALQESNRVEDALRAYERGVALDPYNAALMFGLGSSHMLLGHNEEALKAYRRVLELDTTGTQYASLAEGFIAIVEKLP